MSSPATVRDARFVASATHVLDLPPPTFAEVAFAGKSNVGKSSLINVLLGRKNLARTSSTPGRTRVLNLFRAELAQGTLDVVDLPGYGYAKVSKAERRAWGPMIEAFLQRRAGLCCVVVIVDARRGLQDEDVQLLDFLSSIGRDALLVATKIDKLPRSRVWPSLDALELKAGGRTVIGFSAQTQEGRDELWRTLLARAGLSDQSKRR
jgi:GTP-binding protein